MRSSNRPVFDRLLRFGPLLVVGLLAAATASAAPEVGAPAPAFDFHGVDGARYRSVDYFERAAEARKGAPRGVVIAWFPKAFTPG